MTETSEMNLLARIAGAVVDLAPRRTAELTGAALAQGIEPRRVLLEGLAAGMRRVGELFAAKEFFVPEVLSASHAMEAGFALVRPMLESSPLPSQGRIALGVVTGDIHDIGKNIVKVLLQAEGFEVLDLGRDVPRSEFTRCIAEHRPDILGLSALMTTTMTVMAEIIQDLQTAGLRSAVKVLVGGAPLTPDFAQLIGADGYAPDAPTAIREVRRLLFQGIQPRRRQAPDS
ncbi:MAG: corrinoid protein [candidate division WOR-3 bacterium]